MKIILIQFGLLFILTSCCSDTDFIFRPEYRNLIDKYKLGDTIYFQNSTGDVDTILISNLDSMQVCSKVTNNHKYVTVEIKHLPTNKWNGGQVIENGKSVYLDQALISVDKQLKNANDSEYYYVGINFRDFLGQIKNIHDLQADTLFNNLGIKTYWLVTNDMLTDRGDTTEIDKIIWTEKFGLTGYLKRNGDLYKIARR